jgi:hypothetical protein
MSIPRVNRSDETRQRPDNYTDSFAEVVEYVVAFGLSHFGVNVVATVVELSYLLGEQLHSQRRVAEDDRLL